MDWYALSRANGLVGNDPGAAAIECALGGISIRFDAPAIVAITGAVVRATLSGKSIEVESTVEAPAGSELEIQEIRSGRFYYVAMGGGIDLPELMGSRSTYLPGAFGGWNGRRLELGDTLPLSAPTARAEPRPGSGSFTQSQQRSTVRVIRCAQTPLFGPARWQSFMQSSYQVTVASDRTGYRLNGTALPHELGDLPSEGACVGAVQVPPDGQPIVLMADCPTVGGYPKIAVVITVDLPLVAQRSPGENIAFAEATLDEAAEAWRALAGSGV